MKLRVTFGVNLARLRRAAGWTQEELAHEAEVERAYISRLEAGKKNASIDMIERLAVALRVDAAEFLKVPPKVKRKG